MLVHILDQPEVAKGAGPIGLVLAPTRELAEQIHKEARRFAKPHGDCDGARPSCPGGCWQQAEAGGCSRHPAFEGHVAVPLPI
jgi:hypothetical protein